MTPDMAAQVAATAKLKDKTTPRAKLAKSQKGALDHRPPYIWCVVWQDGRSRVWFERGPWQKLREKVAAVDWPLPLSSRSDDKPRFFRGAIEWWQFFDATEEDDA